MSPTSKGEATGSNWSRSNKNKNYGIKLGQNQKMTKAQSIMNMLNSSLKQRVDDEKFKTKVPIEYQMKYMA